MGDHDHGHRVFVPEPAHQGVDLGADAGIERAEGFVQQQHRGPHHQRLRQRKPLLHAARQLRGILRLAPASPTSASSAAPRSARPARAAPRPPGQAAGAQFGAQHDVLQRGQMRKDRIALIDHAAVRPGFGRQRLRRPSGCAARRAFLPRSMRRKVDLPQPDGTDQRHEGARRDGRC
jgi:hypothetical protein